MLSPELTLLIQGRALLSDPKKWTAGAMARNSRNTPIGATHSDAICWCSMGILRLLDQGQTCEAATRLLEDQVLKEPRDEWLEPGEVPDLPMYNDRNDYETVLALWDKVIAEEYARQIPPETQPDPDTIW